MATIEGSIGRIGLDKRCYLPGATIVDTCPHCKKSFRRDLSKEYLSFPVVNQPTQETLYCRECDNEWEITIQINLSIEVVSE